MATVDEPRADEQHESLKAERDFLLRSLDDLDANRAAGDIDGQTYERLHADYTARAAAVIRALRDGVDARPAAAPVSRRRRLAVVGGLVVFAVLASVALAAALGARRGDDPQAHLVRARSLLNSNKLVPALKEYAATARLDPKNAEARAYAGWILFLEGFPDDALKSLDAAVAADPTFADSHVFRGMVLFQAKNDPCHAVPELQQYLAAVKQTALRPRVEQVLATAVKACPNK
jgi:tetratricopeptide (TPR) repeat protein